MYLSQPSHALLLFGEDGSGKHDIAMFMASAMLGITIQELTKQPNFTLIKKPDNKSDIPIEVIRQLIKDLALKPSGGGRIKRVVLIEDANHLSQEAQNAILKVFEEPSSSTSFIMTVISLDSVLPTIKSRAQAIKINPIPESRAFNHYKGSYRPQEIKSAWGLSGGNARLLDALLKDADHEIKASIASAREFLQSDTYNRLLIADHASKNKDNLDALLYSLEKIFGALQKSPKNNSKIIMNSLLYNRDLVIKLRQKLAVNSNSRLVALELSLNLKK
jgi:DNA polymerase III delta prime subunit